MFLYWLIEKISIIIINIIIFLFLLGESCDIYHVIVWVCSLIIILILWIVSSGCNWSNDYWLESGQVMTFIEQNALIYGFKLFVLSEFFLFVGAFGTYINLRLNLSNFGLYSLFPLFSTIVFSLPFSNLLILLTSGFPLSSSQIFSKIGNFELFLLGLIQTLSASLIFISLQLKEFTYSYFSFYDNMLGSIFYFTVGTHGSHVIVGSLLIYFTLLAGWCAPFDRENLEDYLEVPKINVKSCSVTMSYSVSVSPEGKFETMSKTLTESEDGSTLEQNLDVEKNDGTVTKLYATERFDDNFRVVATRPEDLNKAPKLTE